MNHTRRPLVPALAAWNLETLGPAIVVVGLELAAVLLMCAALYLAARLIITTVVGAREERAAWRPAAIVKARNLALVTAVTLVTIVLSYNGLLIARGVDVREHTLGLVRAMTPAFWNALGGALLRLALATVVMLVLRRFLRRGLRILERSINQWDQLRDNNRALATLFNGLDRAIGHLGWMLLAVLAGQLVGAPPSVTGTLTLAVRIYLVVAIGLMIIGSTSVVVDTLDGLSRRFAESRGWLRQYEHLRPLIPTLRACLEYALWIGLASLVVVQLQPIQAFAKWGPLLIQAIAIFFAARVLIELGRLEIGHRMLPPEGLDETERRRRATMVPLVRSAFTYAVYFGTAVLILSSMGFNPMPFLAGAGILGLVIGFGAQSLINDVVSGFFILFENIYLVGERVEVGAARGVVEAIEFRTTKIRDDEGRVHVIRNGDMKPVINYSRDYMIAVVTVDVAYDADLHGLFNVLQHAGQRLRAEHADVLADTEIDGITQFGPSSMTVRTSTRVRPGRHEAVAASLRYLINDTFDRQTGVVPRKTLVPQSSMGREPRRAVHGT